jgi:hypothetical protein
MNASQRLVCRSIAAGLVLGFSLQAVRAAPPLRANPVYRKMLHWSAGIKTSVADIEVHTRMRSFPPASFTFHGHSYFKAPDQQAVVFDDVPRLMHRLVDDSPALAPVQVWPQVYDVDTSDDGTTTTFHLVPKDSSSPVSSIEVDVSDDNGLVTKYIFSNQNGSTVTTEPTYQPEGNREVVAQQVGHARGHGYDAEVTTTFSNYRFNVPVPDEVFANKS